MANNQSGNRKNISAFFAYSVRSTNSPLRSCKYVFTILFFGLFAIRCKHGADDTQKSNSNNITQLVQAVLNDSSFRTEIIEDFGEEPLKLVAGPVLKANQ